MLWQLLPLLGFALANFKISTDKNTYSATDTMEISWEDDGNLPSIDSYKTAKFLLCTYGSSGKLFCPVSLGLGVDIDGKTSSSFDLSTVKADGGSGQYVVQMVAMGSPESIYVINYGTTWMPITGFTGTGTAVSGAIPANSNYGGSAGQAELPSNTISVPSQYSNLESEWMTPYIYQQGLTRYAPYQLTPNTTVTMPLTITRRHSTSSVSIFTAWVKTPLPITTLTPPPSITITLVPNSASSFHAAYTGRTASRVTPTAVYRQRRWVD